MASPPPRYRLRRLAGIARPPVTVEPPPRGVTTDWDVAVPVRDGTRLRVNVFRPAGGGRHPVILSGHPYNKDALPRRRGRRYRPPLTYRMLRQPRPVRFSAWTGWEAPDPAFWVARGYAVINCDLRGCGTSEGTGELLSELEGRDLHDLIEWAAAQPWSTGRVGMNGVSYLALSQYRAAAERPPSLAAICPWEGFTDPYRDLCYPGGVREDGFIRFWSRGIRGQRLRGDFRTQQLAHPLRDEWWRDRVPALERIEVPMLVCASFSDHNLHSQGSFRAFERAGSERKWVWTHRGGKWATYYSPEALAAQARFLDRFLLDADNGQDDEPPVRLAVHDTRDEPAEVRGEGAWPPAGGEPLELHLAPGGRLEPAAPTGGGEVAFDSGSGAASFAWTVPEPLELTGPMALRLSVALEGADDANLFVAVEKWRNGAYVPFEGSYGFGYDHVTTGWLKLSHRELDERESRPEAPVHTHLARRPLAPGETATVEVALRPSATTFRAGDQLRLVVRGRWPWPRNPISGQLPAAYEPSPRCRVVVHLGGDPPARLLARRVINPGQL